MNKVLIANRGEIAVRVIKSLKKMGIKSVAIYSEADRRSPHVILADEAYLVGPPPSSQSYLNIDKVIEIAINSQCDGIHPGYGFLSENPVFARKVEDAGITFIGPSPESMEVMGSKLAAKEAVGAYDIPMVPGSGKAIVDKDEAQKIADQIGYPILVKASAGGGGKGMRLVDKPSDLSEQMDRAISEAQSSFGDPSVFIEKFVTKPRHIEIQILADNHGNTVHLFERECSIQRRHQKVVEEAPSAVLTPELRKAIGQTAVDVAKSVNYTGAGTVEFLLDHEMNYYFLEMNTRLQVEHPVSELITGLDLVEWQVRVAKNEKLSFTQDDLSIHGHAIELRVYAEDPQNDFLPSIGKLTVYQPPSGENIRVDDGFQEGMEIPIYYDPMLSKLIVWANDRSSAIQKMIEAIDDYNVEGVQTTLPFGKFVMQNEYFISGDFDTNFVPLHFQQEKQENTSEDIAGAKAALAFFLKARQEVRTA